MYSIILLLLRVSTSESMITRPYFQTPFTPLSCPLALKRIGTLLHFCFVTLNLHPLSQSSCSLNLFCAQSTKTCDTLIVGNR